MGCRSKEFWSALRQQGHLYDQIEARAARAEPSYFLTSAWR
jgi:hypothetical protein